MDVPQTTGTVSADDARLAPFAEALNARGIDLRPEALQAFAEKKDRGESEAQIIANANAWTDDSKRRNLTKDILTGTTLGAIATPAGDWLKRGRPEWREAIKRAPKVAALGGLVGAGLGWAVSAVQNRKLENDLKGEWAEFQHNTREMESAWAEALVKRSATSSDAPTR